MQQTTRVSRASSPRIDALDDEDGGASLRPFFEPRSIAVIGAGTRRGHVGAEIFRNVRERFRGRVVPVHRTARTVQGVRACARVTDVAGAVDLAIVAVPPSAVEAAVDDCLAKRVPAIIVITAGFGECGEEGRAREEALRRKVRAAGARMIGPNCLGLVNTDPVVQLNATFAPLSPPPGPLAFSSQSGALGVAVLAYAKRLNLGMASFVSVGNKADVSTNDLLEYWEHDPRVGVILLYVEDFGNPRRFSQIARRVARRTPILAVKAGRSRSGARAAASHTGALAASDTVIDALFREAGVIRTATIEELFEAAALLAQQPIPEGPRVAILTNAGGPAILAADACEALGLAVPPLSRRTTDALRAFLPAAASVTNPVDMIATASADDYRRAIPLLLRDPGVDALLTIFIPPLATTTADAARAIGEAAAGSGKPVLASFVGAEEGLDALGAVPRYAFPEGAARALAHAVAYGRLRGAPVVAAPAFRDVDAATARRLVDHAAGGAWLPPLDAVALLRAFGIPVAPTRPVATAAEALAVRREIGPAIVLKGFGPAIVHKTESRAVRTNLATDEAVSHAFAELAATPGVTQVLAQPMLAGVEMLLGATLDPTFGHVLVCGSGGTMAELLKDSVCRLHPVSESTARDMLDSVRGIALVRGFRGAPRGDEAALRDVLLRLSALVAACPEIADLDLNPVLVTPSGVQVVDVRVRIAR